MPVVEESIVINRPRSEVFAFAIDPAHIPLYNSNLIEFEQTTSGPVGKGTQNRGVTRLAGRNVQWTSEVIEFEQDRRWTARSIEADVPPFEIDVTYDDVDGGTRVTWHQEAESFGGFFGKLADPLVTRIYTKDVHANLEKLKALIEAM